MNILVFSWRDPKHPTAGGAEQVMHEHMKGWVEAGHGVTLFSSRVIGLPKEEILDGIKILRRGDQYFGVKFFAFLFWLKNGKNYDFVVDQFHGIPFFTPFYVKKAKLAVLQEVAGKVWFLNEFPFPFNYLIGLLGYLIEPIIFLFYKHVPFMVGSQSAKKDLARFGIPNRNITVIPHGVIIERPKPFPKKEEVKTVVFLGALAKDKGIEAALKVFSILTKIGEYHFWIIGREAQGYKKYLISVCEKLGIVDRVKFWGFVDQKKKFELLARAHILINPSVREGWGLVNIEANAVGTPVVAYSSMGLVDSVKSGVSGIVTHENNPEELAKMIRYISGDCEKYQKLQKGALNWSKKFTWEKSRKMSIDLLRKLPLY